MHVPRHRVVLFFSDPLPLTKVKVTEIAGTSATVRWTSNKKSIQDSYQLRYKGLNQATEWTIPESVTGQKKTITDLFPGDQYTFEVKAVGNEKTSLARTAKGFLGKYLGTSIISCKLFLIQGDNHLQEHINEELNFLAPANV